MRPPEGEGSEGILGLNAGRIKSLLRIGKMRILLAGQRDVTPDEARHARVTSLPRIDSLV